MVEMLDWNQGCSDSVQRGNVGRRSLLTMGGGIYKLGIRNGSVLERLVEKPNVRKVTDLSSSDYLETVSGSASASTRQGFRQKRIMKIIRPNSRASSTKLCSGCSKR